MDPPTLSPSLPLQHPLELTHRQRPEDRWRQPELAERDFLGTLGPDAERCQAAPPSVDDDPAEEEGSPSSSSSVLVTC